MTTLRTTALVVMMTLGAGCGSTSAADGGPGGDGGRAGGAGGGASGAAPTVTSTSPADTAADVALNAKVSATFSVAMNATVTGSAVTLKQGAVSIAGAVTVVGNTATFVPAANLAPNAVFTATVSTAATNLGGVALAAPYSFSFTTGTSLSTGPAPVGLGNAGRYVVMAKAGISTVPRSMVTGDLGLSPAAQSFVTGFSLVADATNAFATSTQVVGKVYAADGAAPTPDTLTTAVGNMEAAYDDAAGRTAPDFLELASGNLGGLTLVPGLYKWTSTVTVPTDVTLAGGANDVWILQTSGNLVTSGATNVVLSGGARAQNVFWQVAGQTTLGATSHLEGIILSKTAITLQTGSSLTGRALAQTQVALQQATVTQPLP